MEKKSEKGWKEMMNGVPEILFKSQNGLYLGHSSHLDNVGDLNFKNRFYGKLKEKINSAGHIFNRVCHVDLIPATRQRLNTEIQSHGLT